MIDVVRLTTIIFAAGQETTVRLLMSGMRVLCEQPAVAEELRSDPGGIPNFVEECLRLESPIKGSFRMALRDTTLAGVDIPAGSMTMAVIGAANRDPRVFEDPDRFDASARTSGATSPSVTANTSVSAPVWPAPRRASASSGCWRGSTTFDWWTRAHSPTWGASSSAA